MWTPKVVGDVVAASNDPRCCFQQPWSFQRSVTGKAGKVGVVLGV